MWYNKDVKRKENRTADAEKNQKKSQKPLDKRHKVWYNKDTKDKDSLKHQKGIDTMANKVTKKDNFNAIIAILKSVGKDDLVAVMEHEVELLNRKAENRSTKPTVRQDENAKIKDDLVSKMVYGQWYRCAELQALNEVLAAGVGTQRTARLCNDMADPEKGDCRLRKKVEKKVVYFALAE